VRVAIGLQLLRRALESCAKGVVNASRRFSRTQNRLPISSPPVQDRHAEKMGQQVKAALISTPNGSCQRKDSNQSALIPDSKLSS
jgi:hypothetical protein